MANSDRNFDAVLRTLSFFSHEITNRISVHEENMFESDVQMSSRSILHLVYLEAVGIFKLLENC